jgi:hypothetical protein
MPEGVTDADDAVSVGIRVAIHDTSEEFLDEPVVFVVQGPVRAYQYPAGLSAQVAWQSLPPGAVKKKNDVLRLALLYLCSEIIARDGG